MAGDGVTKTMTLTLPDEDVADVVVVVVDGDAGDVRRTRVIDGRRRLHCVSGP